MNTDVTWMTTGEGDHWVTEICFKMRTLNPPMINGLVLREALLEAAKAAMPEEVNSKNK